MTVLNPRLLLAIILFTSPLVAAKELRIITLSPHLTELVYSAGAGDFLVGTVMHSNYPQQARSLPVVGDFSGVKIEAILALQPDLILAWQSGNRPQDVKRLKSLSIPIKTFAINGLSDIPNQIKTIAELADTLEKSQNTIIELRTILKDLDNLYRSKTPKKVFFQLWDKPLITVNQKQYIGQAIHLCSGENLFASSIISSPKVSIESLIHLNPEIILIGGPASMQKQWSENWLDFSMISAVKNNHLILLNADIIQRPTERFIRYLPTLCQLIHHEVTH